MKGSRLKNWSKKQLTNSDRSDIFLNLSLSVSFFFFLKKRCLFYVETTISRNETLVLSEEKKTIVTNFMDHVFFLPSPGNRFCFLSSAGGAHFFAMPFL